MCDLEERQLTEVKESTMLICIKTRRYNAAQIVLRGKRCYNIIVGMSRQSNVRNMKCNRLINQLRAILICN